MASIQKRIMSLSFKEDEAWLWDVLREYSCPSSIVKDVLKAHFKNRNSSNQNQPIIEPPDDFNGMINF